MLAQELKPYITKFIRVVLDDGSVHTGFVSNPKDFKGDQTPKMLSLLNGLMFDSVEISRIISIDLPEREDTVSIPILSEADIEKYNRG